MRLPRLLRLRSTLALILMGFALVLIPIISAYLAVTYFANQIATKSSALVELATQSAKSGRELANHLTTMERSVLQYMVVKDEELLDVYRDSHDNFQSILAELTALSLGPDQRLALLKLNRVEWELFQAFGDPLVSPNQGERPVAWFAKAREHVQEFIFESDAWVKREVDDVDSLASFINRMLYWVGFALIPLLLIVAALFSGLIVRPLRSVSRAIHQLGRENFDNALVVRGPRDVEELGKRLNWLRLQLGEIEHQKARFLRHMSHELKTPLTGLREAAELLAEEVIGPLNEDQRQVVRIMRENTFIFQELIINLVNFNQALLRNQVMNYEMVELDKLIERVVMSQQLAWKAKGLRIYQHLEPVKVRADRAKLTTILDNLLSNAIKFSPRNAMVEVRLLVVEFSMPVAQIDVSDAGPGFHPDDRDSVFDAFYQGRHLPESHIKGSGLGLAIAREYTEAHNGTIRVVTDESAGGHIQVKLPVGEGVV